MPLSPFADNSLLELLFENRHTLVAYLDLDSNFVRVSQAYALADGHDTDYFIAKNYFELFPSDENKTVFNNVIKTGKPYSANATSCKDINSFGDEDSFWDWSLSPVKNENGEVEGALLQLVDVTRTKLLKETVAMLQHENDERVKTQALLEKAKEEAEKANISKSQFLSRMSHELRTPLNAILGFSQLLQINSLDEKQDSYNDEILLAGYHLLAMISDILDLSRIDEGNLAVSLSEVSLPRVIQESISLVKHKLDFRNITIHNLIEGGDNISVKADETRLKEVLVNILTNAVKYNVDNGLISIGYKPVAKNQISIYISDTGKGLSEEEQASIFEPFNRLGAEYTDIEGVGIGLTISQKLMEMMDGSISIESEKGRGSTFNIICPTGKALEIKVDEEASVDLDDADYLYNVLYVEDNKSNQTLVENLFFEYPNINLKISATAEDGLISIADTYFDLIILDINLPGMNGYDALEKIKMSAKTKHIPVVALTAAASENDIKKGLNAGFNRYITKPVNLTELISIINDELNHISHH